MMGNMDKTSILAAAMVFTGGLLTLIGGAIGLCNHQVRVRQREISQAQQPATGFEIPHDATIYPSTLAR